MDDVGAVSLGTWVEFDVTQAIAGAGLYSFRLSSTSTNSVKYGSTESANPPELVIEARPSNLSQINSFEPALRSVSSEEASTLTSGDSPASASSAPASSLLQNNGNPYDVNEDEQVSPLDVLLIINILNESAAGEESAHTCHIFPDVSGDSIVSPLDALLVINYLTRPILVAGEGEDEGEGNVSLEDSPLMAAVSINEQLGARWTAHETRHRRSG